MNKKDDILKNIDSYLTFVKFQFNADINKDIVIREFVIADSQRAFIAFIDGMADKSVIDDFILRTLMYKSSFPENLKKAWLNNENHINPEYIIKNVLTINQLKHVTDPQEILTEILVGNTAIFLDGNEGAITCETRGYEKRSVDKPQVEGVVRGAQEGFSENLRTNTTLVRRIIKNKNLVTEFLTVGERNNAPVAIMYMKDIANPSIIEEVKRRINGINTDLIESSGMLEQFIEDNPMSILPNVLTTERPDRTAANIIDGKVAIIIDGTPFSIIVPITLVALMHSPEDTSLRWQYASFLRIVRILAIVSGILLPGLYIAITTFHHEMIPTDLLIAIGKARENVPFPTIIEVILMEASFELIREASVRIPGMIGNTIGIIGALILGQAAVQANLVSPILIIVIAFTGLGNFAIPDFSFAFGIRIYRVIFIILGALFGFYGISLGVIVALVSISMKKSFGVSMMAPYAPFTSKGDDQLLKGPVWEQEKRQDYLNAMDVYRQPAVSRVWTLAKKAKDFYIKSYKDTNTEENSSDKK